MDGGEGVFTCEWKSFAENFLSEERTFYKSFYCQLPSLQMENKETYRSNVLHISFKEPLFCSYLMQLFRHVLAQRTYCSECVLLVSSRGNYTIKVYNGRE